MTTCTRSLVSGWSRLSCLLLLASAAVGWKFDPWTQQWVADQPQQAASERQGHAYQGYQDGYQQQFRQQQDYSAYQHAAENHIEETKSRGKSIECSKKDKAGRCLSRQERELLLPNGFSLGFEPKVAFKLYDDENMGKLKIQMKTAFSYTPPKSLVDAHGRSLQSSGGVMMDKQVLYNTFKTMMSRFGADGDACLQRSVCEVAEAPLRRDGMIGEILNLVLSPSHRLDESQSAEVADLLIAERRGREVGECHLAYPRCPLSLFNVIDSASDYTGSILDALADHDQVFS